MKKFFQWLAIGALVYMVWRVFQLLRKGFGIADSVTESITGPWRLSQAAFNLVLSPEKLKAATPYLITAGKAIVLSPLQAAVSLPVVQEQFLAIYDLAFNRGSRADTNELPPPLILQPGAYTTPNPDYQYSDEFRNSTLYSGNPIYKN